MPLSKSTFTIQSCANIDYSEINIKRGSINIKFGNNGVGKTSILKAIEGKLNGNNEMIKELEQYTSGRLPDIKSDGEISKVISFNESYINQFLFEPDDLLKNSHSILIDTDSFKNEVRDINSLVATIQATITGNSEITQHITNLNTFINSIKLTNADKINATSPFHKAMKDGNLFVSPATEITRYGELIKKSEWIAWHKTGTDKFFDSDIEACPFCTSDITETQIESIESVKKSFTKVQVDHLVNSLSVLENLSSIVSESNSEIHQLP